MTDDALPRYPPSHRARVGIAVIGVLLALGAVTVWWRFHYGIWPGARYPSAVHYCGRTYDRDHGASQSARASLAREISASDYDTGSTMYPAFRFDAPFAESYPVFASHPRDVHVGDTPTCATKVYLRSGPDQYLTYSLSGSVG